MKGNPEVDVKALASLSRIHIDDSDVSVLEQQLKGILSFVEEIQKVPVGDVWREENPRHNIMREDEDAHESGLYTDVLLDAAPKRTGDYLEVKQVLGHVKKQGTNSDS